MIGLIGFLPIWMLMVLQTTGENPNILGYRLRGLMVPDVRITEGNLFQIGCKGKEASRQDKVRRGSAISPSIG